MLRLQAQVVTTVLEGGADLAALDLLVLVVGQAARRQIFSMPAKGSGIRRAESVRLLRWLDVRQAAALGAVVMVIAVLVAMIVAAAMQMRAGMRMAASYS